MNKEEELNLVNISIDDVSPHPLSSTRVLDRCYELIEEFADIKFTLFVPISYWRTQRPEARTPHPLQIDLYEDFCEEIRTLSAKNFEIGYHGFYHGIPGETDNDEFMSLDREQAKRAFKAMFEVVQRAKLSKTFKPIFRPPAWRMSSDTFDVCREFNIDILALYDGHEEYLEIYDGKDKEYQKVLYANVIPPAHPLKLYEKTEIVYHACEWDKNFLDIEKTEELKNFLQNNQEKIQFCFMGDFFK